MENSDRINRPASIALDLIRVGAALMVLVGHAVHLKIYIGPYPFDEMPQHNAVIVFFVLSGLLISHSIKPNKTTTIDYISARVSRILPTALFGILVGILSYEICQKIFEPSNFNSLKTSTLTAQGTFSALFFMSEWGNSNGPVWNSPYWSLCYEVWYYVIFGIATLANGKTRLFFLALSIIGAGSKIIIMLPVWLFGVAVNRIRSMNNFNLIFNIAFLLVGLLISLLANQYSNRFTLPDLQYSQFVFSDYILGIGVAICLISIIKISCSLEKFLYALSRPVKKLLQTSHLLST
jgi:peptidoglycan/LPS O-acetylase OafA/YrhL